MGTCIDLNCDLGEGAGRDDRLMPFITSANIACGAHAGDEATMRSTILLAKQSGVALGAHPGFADREQFGRREFVLTPTEIVALVSGQIRTLQALATEAGTQVRFVKPHGALYNLAARDAVVADAIAEAVAGVDNTLWLYGLAGGELLRAGRARGLKVASEVFADRTYQADGSLTPRAHPDALIKTEALAVRQALRMIQERKVGASDGTDVTIVADTLCLHGDATDAVTVAQGLREALAKAGVTVRALTRI